MKVYGVKVGTCDAYTGRWTGWEVMAYALDKAVAEREMEKRKTEIMNKPTWWMTYDENDSGEPTMEVEELGEVVEG